MKHLFSILVLLHLYMISYAETYTFNVSSGNWNVQTNCSPFGTPGICDRIKIIGDTVFITSDTYVDAVLLDGHGVISASHQFSISYLLHWKSGIFLDIAMY